MVTNIPEAALSSMLQGWTDPREAEPSDWAKPAHRAIHKALCDLRGKSVEPDLMLVANELANEPPDLWRVELFSLPDYAVAKENAKYHMRAFHDECAVRRFKTGVLRLSERVTKGEHPTDMVPDLEALRRLADPRDDGSLNHVVNGLGEMLMDGPQPHVPLGIEGLSRLKIRPGNMCTIAARPGTGKSAMLTTIALNAATAGWPVLLFSLEMTGIEVRQRLLTASSRIPLDQIMDPDPSLIPHAEALGKLPIWIEAGSNLTLETIAPKIRTFSALHPRGVVMVDYLQRMRSRAKIEKRYELIGHMCRTLKDLALSIPIPILLAAQLSRAAETRGKESLPLMSDLRESGDIEQESDQVVLMHREWGSLGKTLVKVSKNRNGESEFKTELQFTGPCCVFEDYRS